MHFAISCYKLNFFAETFRTGRTSSLCSKTSEYAKKRFNRVVSMDTCSPARTVRQVGEDRPTTEQYLSGLFRLSPRLHYSLQCSRTHCCGRLQVCIVQNHARVHICLSCLWLLLYLRNLYFKYNILMAKYLFLIEYAFIIIKNFLTVRIFYWYFILNTNM